MRVAGVVFATAALLAAGSPATSLAAKPRKAKKPTTPATVATGFCSSPIVDNYWAPIEKLQPIPALPEGGVLPFAPVGMTLGATGPQRILVGGSSIGFHLTNGAPATAAKPRRLRWIAQSCMRLRLLSRRSFRSMCCQAHRDDSSARWPIRRSH